MTPTRRLPVLLSVLLLSLCLIAPGAVAGNADDPEITDPEGDQDLSGGGPLLPVLQALGEDEAFDDVDLLAAWVHEPDSATIAITVRAAAAVQDDTLTHIHFNVSQGPSSVFASNASGAEFMIEVLGTTLQNGPANTNVTADTTDLTVTFPRSSVGASGGDLIAGLWIERSRSTDDLAPTVAPGQTATDRAPDEGTGRAYALQRDPIVPAATLTVQGGRITESGQQRTFLAPSVSTQDGNATVTWDFAVRNSGTDADAVSVTVASPPGAVVSPSRFELDPGQTATGTVTLTLSAATGATQVPLTATSERGATATATARVTVIAPVGPGPADDPDGRTPIPAGLTWLSPIAEGMRLDALFGDYAELVLLAVIVLLLILLILWVLLLLGRRRDEEEDEGPGPVLTETSSDISGLSLQQVGHHPKDPGPGEAVTTSLVLANNGIVPARARLVLVVDDHPVQEKVVDAPARGRVRVRFPWIAGAGENRVKVQMYPA